MTKTGRHQAGLLVAAEYKGMEETSRVGITGGGNIGDVRSYCYTLVVGPQAAWAPLRRRRN